MASFAAESEQLRKQHSVTMAENSKLKAALAQATAAENELRAEVDRAQHDLTLAAEKMGQQSLVLAEVQGELSLMHSVKRRVPWVGVLPSRSVNLAVAVCR
jgi:septal ring factor EnvC (AmiA/AmiB activator)